MSTYLLTFRQRIQVKRPESWKVIIFRPHKYYRYHPANPSVAGIKLLNLTTSNTQQMSMSKVRHNKQCWGTLYWHFVSTQMCRLKKVGPKTEKRTSTDFIITLKPLKSLLSKHISTKQLQYFRPTKQFILPA